MWLTCVAGLLAVVAQPSTDQPPTPPEPAWQTLFDGRSLEHWVQAGEPDAWAIQDGNLVVAKPGKGWWLRTARMYRDFDLELEFNLSPGANSGIGIRGSSTGDPAFTGLEIQVLDSPGQTPEIWSCGAVYNAIPPAQDAVKPAGQWNSYRILLVADTLNVWLNGVQVQKDQKLDDRGFFRQIEQKLPLADRLPTGFIALQDHGDPVQYRNIRIRDLSPDPEPEEGYLPLFNNTDLAGWNSTGVAKWTVEEGTLIGRDGPGHLFSDAVFTDFELRAFVKVNRMGNSGIYFRAVPNDRNGDSWPTGYEAQIDNHDPKNFTGAVYDRAKPPGVDKPFTRDDAWFDYRIRAQGNHIQTWINGRPMVDAELTAFSSGHFALQGHHPGNVIMYRDIRVRSLERDEPTKPEGDHK
ncbi:MAG: DUF1080 domain-containing protein [Leptolyngbya sp. PLA3]|nr:MAG: DUF1080 domain-containing protein [Cyanobacteria bacterium CYA]MCE7967609.1 DUF1080 domain-containing protein [Leptolyngbya sp. PL-A3]